AKRPWHVLGQLLVLKKWCSLFDPYEEELEWVESWVRVPRIPTELMNFSTISTLIEANDIGKLIKIDQRSLLRNRIRFVQACMALHEDFSQRCSFCGDIEHSIDDCPILNTPPKEVRITVKKAPILQKKIPQNHTCPVDETTNQETTTTYIVKAKYKVKTNTNPTNKQSTNLKSNPKSSNRPTRGTRIGNPNVVQTKNKAKTLPTNPNDKGKVKLVSNDPDGPLEESCDEEIPSPKMEGKTNPMAGESSSIKFEEKGQKSALERSSKVAQTFKRRIDDSMIFDFEFPLEQKGFFLNNCGSFETSHSNFAYYDHAILNSGDLIANRIEQMEVDLEKEEPPTPI
ncbi:Protein lifeguard 1, partial [Bienertia sinuspersici]